MLEISDGIGRSLLLSASLRTPGSSRQPVVQALYIVYGAPQKESIWPMSQLKTTQNEADANEFPDAVENPRRRADARQVLDLIWAVTGEPPLRTKGA